MQHGNPTDRKTLGLQKKLPKQKIRSKNLDIKIISINFSLASFGSVWVEPDADTFTGTCRTGTLLLQKMLVPT